MYLAFALQSARRIHPFKFGRTAHPVTGLESIPIPPMLEAVGFSIVVMITDPSAKRWTSSIPALDSRCTVEIGLEPIIESHSWPALSFLIKESCVAKGIPARFISARISAYDMVYTTTESSIGTADSDASALGAVEAHTKILVKSVAAMETNRFFDIIYNSDLSGPLRVTEVLGAQMHVDP